jgi:hypothetical protein
MAFARFMAGPIGRLARIIAGVVLIVLGLQAGGTGGIILAIVGVLPILAGALNFCLIAPILGAPFSGKESLK